MKFIRAVVRLMFRAFAGVWCEDDFYEYEAWEWENAEERDRFRKWFRFVN